MRRLRPIVLTAAAAVLAMIPLSRSVFWGPMAVAIMGGLIVATAADAAVPAGDVRRVVPGQADPCGRRALTERDRAAGLSRLQHQSKASEYTRSSALVLPARAITDN